MSVQQVALGEYWRFLSYHGWFSFCIDQCDCTSWVNVAHFNSVLYWLMNHLNFTSESLCGTHPIVRKLHYVFPHCVCMLLLFGWPTYQRSDMTLMEVSKRALDSLYIRNIWLWYIVMFFVNLIWYPYLFESIWVWVCIFREFFKEKGPRYIESIQYHP